VSGPQVILHLGLGSFHRAHQSVYLHQLRQLGDQRWSLMGGNIRPDMEAVQQALHKQAGAYTLETISPEGVHHYLRVTSIENVIAWDESLSGLIQAAADPRTKIISFTVTEAGYYLDASNTLEQSNAEVQSDLRKAMAGLAGHTIYGALTALLRARIASGAGPVTLLNCDNLRHNGDRSRAGLLQFVAKLNDPVLLDWIEHHTSSPNAMVDRITPRPTAEVVERVAKATGVRDPAALMGESFIQWVIEDRFIAGRPDWARVGVELVTSVDAYEEAKIRVLNATHSCIAWAGTLVGYQFIHEGTHDTEIRQFAYDYVTHDVIPVLDTLDKPCPINLANYRDVVLARFGNPAIQDTNQRVAMDGFSKIPGFIVPTIRERLAQGAAIDSVAMLPALFLAYLQRWHAGRIAYTYQDQAMDPALAHSVCTALDPIVAFCAVPSLWGDLANHPPLVAAIRRADQRVQHFIANRT
jgi:D-arabinitol 4-dehydrogenase